VGVGGPEDTVLDEVEVEEEETWSIE